MKKLLALVMAVMMLLLLAACAKNPETPSTSAPSEESTAPTSESASEPTVEEDPYAGLNKDIYVDKEWTILNAKHEKEVTITMWIPNSATSTMGTAIQALADLSRGNRLVGIISHVAGLKERIDRQIIVTKERSGGSRVRIRE